MSEFLGFLWYFNYVLTLLILFYLAKIYEKKNHIKVICVLNFNKIKATQPANY